MSKVKLIVEKYNSLPGMGRVIDLELRLDESERVAGVIRTDFDPEQDGSRRVSDDVDPVVPFEHINHLVGKLLTIVDASTADKEQRQAQKDLFKQAAWDWYSAHGDALYRTASKDKKN